jgi:hypothetical protein
MQQAKPDSDRGYMAIWHKEVIVGERAPDSSGTIISVVTAEHAVTALNINSPGGSASAGS